MKRKLRIAGLTVAIESNGHCWAHKPDSPHRLFEVDEADQDVWVDVHWFAHERPQDCEEVLAVSNDPVQTTPECRMCRDARGFWVFDTNTRVFFEDAHVWLQRVGIFSPDFTQGELFVDLSRHDLSNYPNPLCPPLDRVLFVNLMARQNGMMVHGCGVVHEGRGYIFAGPSGAGKSTMAKLWAEHSDGVVLGEECMILRQQDADYLVYGTPWIGEGGYCSPLGVPIVGIFFLRHALRNTIRPISTEAAAQQLLARSYLTFYDPPAVHRGLDLCLGLVQHVPAYDFGFLPDASAVEAIHGLR